MIFEPHIAYYSSATRATERFVNKLEIPSQKISSKNDAITVPSVLILPTYGSTPPGGGKTNAVPIVVKKVLANELSRSNVVAVVGTGNINFGADYCRAAYEVSSKLRVPILGKVELMGTSADVKNIKERIEYLYANDVDHFIGWPKKPISLPR